MPAAQKQDISQSAGVFGGLALIGLGLYYFVIKKPSGEKGDLLGSFPFKIPVGGDTTEDSLSLVASFTFKAIPQGTGLIWTPAASFTFKAIPQGLPQEPVYEFYSAEYYSSGHGDTPFTGQKSITDGWKFGAGIVFKHKGEGRVVRAGVALDVFGTFEYAWSNWHTLSSSDTWVHTYILTNMATFYNYGLDSGQSIPTWIIIEDRDSGEYVLEKFTGSHYIYYPGSDY